MLPADAAAPTDPLDRHILRLLMLHKELSVHFDGLDLAKMDRAAKHALLSHIRKLLGIEAVPYDPA